ncbi:hypothetical protein Afil01_55590 [Actinorhabdospora filicis]|uniref:Uncharacterized protein n=1 Tax=Actinorhabdospora filicis TaxID=1785913 RepID=A0A9W6W5T7_9ACTN|nr:hypothetical protein [Actinorhabdospora filicis]GLZ80752.1 hypothetical protein Afil01_55590 [Actinorhabdospora filicis]
MARVVKWLRRNADGVLVLLIAGAVAVLSLLGMFQNIFTPDAISQAILLVLALLAVVILRDRQTTAKALEEAGAVQQINGSEVATVHAEARRGTDLWLFKGGTGTYLRAVTLPECVREARAERRPLRVQAEIIDPSNEPLCKLYSRYRQSLSTRPDGTGERWTLERTRKESYATILAACWYRQQFNFLTIEVGLSQVMSTFRWDLSHSRVIMTQEDSKSPSLVFPEGRPHYRAYHRELVSSFKQSRAVDLERADHVLLDDEPTVDQAREAFAALGIALPKAYTDRDVADIVSKARHARDPYR